MARLAGVAERIDDAQLVIGEVVTDADEQD